jgi:hypothetical protein
MNDLRIRPEAELDTFEAALWYENERPGLGLSFLEAVRETFRRIGERPLHFPVVWTDVMRRAILDRFPFGAFFVVDHTSTPVMTSIRE